MSLRFPKPKREVHKSYKSWVEMQPCCWCSHAPPSIAHHVQRRGAGGSDFSCIPVCQACHDHLHSTAAPKREWEWQLLAEFLMVQVRKWGSHVENNPA